MPRQHRNTISHGFPDYLLRRGSLEGMRALVLTGEPERGCDR